MPSGGDPQHHPSPHRTARRTPERLFTRALDVRTRDPLADPGGVFKGLADVEGWEQAASGSYVIHVTDPDAAAPGVARALVAADADIMSIVESRHSLEDVYWSRRRGRRGATAMSFSWTRVGAILHKELRDYRRNRFVILTMSTLPLLFLGLTMVLLFTIKASISTTRLDERIGLSMLYLLIVRAMVPSALTAYSVVGERERGSLEPVLITPMRREELLLGKALAAWSRRSLWPTGSSASSSARLSCLRIRPSSR